MNMEPRESAADRTTPHKRLFIEVAEWICSSGSIRCRGDRHGDDRSGPKPAGAPLSDLLLAVGPRRLRRTYHSSIGCNRKLDMPREFQGCAETF
jgi:hypothetical protein